MRYCMCIGGGGAPTTHRQTMALTTSHAFCEFKVTIAPIDEPWNTIIVDRFNGSTAEKDAYALAGSIDGLGNTIVQVSCAQCW